MTDNRGGKKDKPSTVREDTGRGLQGQREEGRELEGDKGRNKEETGKHQSQGGLLDQGSEAASVSSTNTTLLPHPKSPVCRANSRGSIHFRGHLKSQGTSAKMLWICHLEAETQANFPRMQGTPTAACEPWDPQGKGTLPAPTPLSSS